MSKRSIFEGGNLLEDREDGGIFATRGNELDTLVLRRGRGEDVGGKEKGTTWFEGALRIDALRLHDVESAKLSVLMIAFR